jgi:DNA polymerase III alpha subunit (gram-positive type)
VKFRVLDCETDNLLDKVTKIHVVAWTDDGVDYNHTGDYDKIKEVLTEPDVICVGHHIVGYDMQVFNKLLGLGLQYKQFIDTLALSWFLFPERNKHGLDNWGRDLGVEKPKVDDWEDVTYEQMCHRCTEDVKINWLLWEKFRKRLEEIYG